MIQRLADVPFEIRMERALELGDLDAIAIALFPGDCSGVFAAEPTVVTERCVQGHLWTEENTQYRPNGWRKCRTCVAEHNERRAINRREQRRREREQ